MGPVFITEGIASVVVVAIALAANWKPYGERVHLFVLACMLLGTWVLEVVAREAYPIPDAWLPAIVTDLACLTLASVVAWLRPSPWTWSMAGLFLIESGVHAIYRWLLRDTPDAGWLNWYYTLIRNILFGLQLLCVATPGVGHVVVWTGLGARVFRGRRNRVPVLPRSI